MPVELVRWPEEASRLTKLREVGEPRLVMVEGSGRPLVMPDPLEDWIRVPADAADVQLRVSTLEARFADSIKVSPEIDQAGLLRFGDSWAAFPPVEARMMTLFVESFGDVIARDALQSVGWPEGEVAGRNALDVHITRIRKRLSGTGLSVRTLRNRGYLLEASS